MPADSANDDMLWAMFFSAGVRARRVEGEGGEGAKSQ